MKWIRVEDRLPEESDDFIIFTDGLCVYCGKYVDPCSFDGNPKFKSYTEGHIFKDSEVTHWMSLPEPPKDET